MPWSKCTSSIEPSSALLHATKRAHRLTVGSACGSIREIFTKIKAIDKKHGKFDFALCVGDFFGPLPGPDAPATLGETDELLAGALEGMSNYRRY